jgi:hypothetical protein
VTSADGVLAFRLGALRLEVDPALAQGMAAELLHRLPAAVPGPAALTLGPARPSVGARPPAAPSFFHGSLRAHACGGGFLVRDGPTTVTVSPDGRSVEIGGPTRVEEGCSELAILVGMVLALRYHGYFHLHAAALVSPGGRKLLVAGAGGAGKTTLAMAMAAAGLGVLGDDAVFAGGQEGSAVVAALPRPLHVGERTAAAFPSLAHRMGAPSAGGKRALPPEALGCLRAPEMAGLPDTLLLPEVGDDATTTVELVSPATALGALLESGGLLAAEGMPAVPQQLAILRAMAEGAGAARVRLGQDILAWPAATARGLLARVPPGRAWA